MKAPFVTRATHEAEVARLQREAERLVGRLTMKDAAIGVAKTDAAEHQRRAEHLQREVDRLSVALEREKKERVTERATWEAKAANAATTPRKRSVIAEAIREQANGDPRLAGYLRRRVAELRADHKTDDEIAAELGKWESTEDVA